MRENSRHTIPRSAQELGISPTSTWRILRHDLGLHPYKMQLTQELKPNDYRHLRAFADWAIDSRGVGSWSYIWAKSQVEWGCWFLFIGFVNKQNYQIWNDEIPRKIYQVPRHSENVTIWCVYWAIITNFFLPRADGMELINIWMQITPRSKAPLLYCEVATSTDNPDSLI